MTYCHLPHSIALKLGRHTQSLRTGLCCSVDVESDEIGNHQVHRGNVYFWITCAVLVRALRDCWEGGRRANLRKAEIGEPPLNGKWSACDLWWRIDSDVVPSEEKHMYQNRNGIILKPPSSLRVCNRCMKIRQSLAPASMDCRTAPA